MFSLETRNRLVAYLSYGFFLLLFAMIAISFSRRGLYTRQLGINLVVVGEDSVALALIRPNEDYLTWVKLPLAMQVKIDGTNAVYPIFSLWKYAHSEKKPLEVILRSLEGTLGVVLPVAVKLDTSVSPENLVTALRSINLKTNLTLRDRIILGKDITTLVTGRKVFEADIPKAALTSKIDPDGVEFLEANNVVGLWTKNKFAFEQLLGENVDVSIYNLSGVDGRGLGLSKKLESAGIRVVKVASKYDGNISGKGCYFSRNERYEQTVYLLNEFLSCKPISHKVDDQLKNEIKVWLL